MVAGKICQRQVDLAEAEENIQVAAQRMCQRMVGTLVIVNEKKEPIGIVTDRDLVTRVLAIGKCPETTRVSEVMTTPVSAVFECTPIETALSTMRSIAVRRLPVVNNEGKLAGMLSVDDITLHIAGEQAQIGGLLEAESPRTYR